ncbi:MAG TPA: CoA ester lyase [Rhizobiaceae bacterium]|nr:CoA ester lyase [Rhizobiaceae bacterium]
MRSLLFVPGDSERKLEKGLASGADVLLIDLEDSVAPDNKPRARAICVALLTTPRNAGGPKLFVRINALSTGMTSTDLDAIMPASPDGVMLPKSNSGNDVAHLASLLAVREAENGHAHETAIIAIVTETAAGALATQGYAGASRRLIGMAWGAEDLSADLGATASRDEHGALTDPFRFARTVTLLGAAAAGVAPIDTVYVNFRNEAGLAAECRAAARDGFTAKMAIHPAQVGPINDAFTPSPSDVARALAIVDAFAAAGNAGVIGIDGEMLDRPHLRRAERLLARAQAAGVAG